MNVKFKALPSNPKVFVVLPPPLYPPYPYNMAAHAINIEFPVLQREITQQADGLIDVCSALMALGGTNITYGPQLRGAPSNTQRMPCRESEAHETEPRQRNRDTIVRAIH